MIRIPLSRLVLPLVLLISTGAAAQQNLQQAVASLETYREQNLQEKVYVHTDKSFYVTGDIIWFRAYLADAENRPSKTSNIIYVEVLDESAKPVQQAKVAVAEGGSGSFQLPLDLPSGRYVLKAYTSMMKNYPAGHFFSKDITIINPLKQEPLQSKASEYTYRLSLFPEGGQLVYGLAGKVAFKLSNQYGSGTESTGYLISGNDTLQTINTTVMGMGAFSFVPEKSRSYQVVMLLPNGRSVSAGIEGVKEQGYVMQVAEMDEKNYRVLVRSNTGADGSEVFLVVHADHKTGFSEKTNMVNGNAAFLVPRSAMREGISVLTIFAAGKPQAERLLFRKPLNVQREETAVTDYFSRKKVDIALPATLNVDPAQASVSVYRIDSLQKRDVQDIAAALWLQSELQHLPEFPAFYFSDHPLASAGADLLMMTNGWRRFKWSEGAGAEQLESIGMRDRSRNSKLQHAFPAEENWQLITARLTDPVTGTPAQGADLFLTIPQTRHKLFVARTNSNGLAHFQVKDFYGKGEMFIQARPADSLLRIEVQSPYFDQHAFNQGSFVMPSARDHRQLEQYSIAMQASNIFHGEKLIRFSETSSADSFPFYGRGWYNYNLDDYKRFTTMEEVLREYVREINVGARASGLRLRLFNEVKREMIEENNLVVVDGVPVFNTSRLFQYDPLLFKRIEIIPRNYVLGSNTYNALAAFYTYKENFEGLEPEKRVLILNYEGLQKQREFYSPVYETEQQLLDRRPDFRTTLFWQPKIAGGISFYTSDTKGTYLVSVQGFDRSGRPLSWTQKIEVK